MREHPVDRTEKRAVVFWWMVGLSPRVEPGGIVLRAHERDFGLVFSDDFEALLRITAEVRRLEEFGDESVLHDARRIARIERDLESSIKRGLAERAHVRDVAAVESVLVLDLHHQDRSALRDLQPRQLASDRMQPVRRGHEPARIGRAHRDRLLFVIVLHQPPRRAAALPLRAAVGAGPQNHPKPLRLRHAAERRDVGAPVPRERALLALVEVPEHVAPDGVTPHRAQHLQTVPPVGARNARVVDLAASHDKRPAVEEEVLHPDLKRARLCAKRTEHGNKR